MSSSSSSSNDDQDHQANDQPVLRLSDYVNISSNVNRMIAAEGATGTHLLGAFFSAQTDDVLCRMLQERGTVFLQQLLSGIDSHGSGNPSSRSQLGGTSFWERAAAASASTPTGVTIFSPPASRHQSRRTVSPQHDDQSPLASAHAGDKRVRDLGEGTSLLLSDVLLSDVLLLLLLLILCASY